MNLLLMMGRSRTARQSIAVCLAFLMLLLISSVFYFPTQRSSATKVVSGTRIGEMRFPPDEHGGCRTVKFNNGTWEIEQDRTIDCHLDKTQDYLGPFESFRKAFSGR